VLVKYQPQGTHACGWYIATCTKELNEQLEARNEAEPMIGNTTKPTRGTVGKENPNLGRRTVVQKAIVPTTSMQETWSSKGTMKSKKVQALTLFEIIIL
jgi:hypothetical protein